MSSYLLLSGENKGELLVTLLWSPEKWCCSARCCGNSLDGSEEGRREG